MTDLAREIEELLPCWAYSGCTGQAHERACLARVRPALTTYVQHKLDEAKADGELLAKVEKLLRDRTEDAGVAGGAIVLMVSAKSGWFKAEDQRAATLREALRKLVESDS